MNVEYTNTTGIPLALLPWYLNDTYDSAGRADNVISATSIIKPLRQIILTKRVPEAITDVSMLTSSRIGTAIHDAIERSWNNPEALDKALQLAKYPKRIREMFKVNPAPGFNPEEVIPVYLEQRVEREILGYVVSGKFDICINGTLGDFKNTSVFTYMNQTNAEKYVLQGSIYRWLNPEMITNDTLEIYHQFTDWSALDAMTKRDKGYPPNKIMTVKYQLMSLQETEAYLRKRIQEISRMSMLPESDLPLCTAEELWMDPPTFKYYANPENTKRSTKNFDNYQEAVTYKVNQGKGIVLEVQGKAKACRYCSAAPVCSQFQSLLTEGKI